MWIFVSHSTDKNDAAGKQRLLDLGQALRTVAIGPAAHDPLIDFERLEPGARWRSVLDEWLAQCHAAILLLTPKALQSSWVLKEATILAHRAALDPQFFLFPVLLDGVSRPQLSAPDSRFSPLYLEALQRVNSVDPAAIAADVQRVLGPVTNPPQTPLERLTGAIAVQIQGVASEEIGRICQLVTGMPIVWQPQDVRSRRCAFELARAVVSGKVQHYNSVTSLVQDLLASGLDRERAQRVLHLVAPLWVELEAAALFPDLAKRNLDAQPDATGRVDTWSLAMNGAYLSVFTADMYMRRVYLPDTVTLRTIDGGESDDRLGDLVDRIRDEVRDREMPRATDTQVDGFLANLTRPYFIVLPPPLPDDTLLGELRRQLPRVTFIGQADELDIGSMSAAERLVRLTPHVDLESELRAFQDYMDAADRIKRA